jgi:hypothetical protein
VKAALKDLVRKSANSPLFWLYTLFLPAVGLGRVYQLARDTRRTAMETARLRSSLFPDLRVRHGPFQGLRYLPEATRGSKFLPKLLGSYEAELHPLLRQIMARPYSAVIDVGCAEGYYAVGFGVRFPQAEIYAFDSDAGARELCREMGRLNGIESRLHVDGLCDAEKLLALPLGERALIVADCEGYERQLFAPAVVSALAAHDVLVEVHDFLDSEIGQTLRARFQASHDIISVESIDDAKKVRLYDYPELQGLTPREKLFILSEDRRAVMEWLYLTPRRARG